MTSRAKKRKLQRETVKDAAKEIQSAEDRHQAAQAEIQAHLSTQALLHSVLASRARRGLRRIR